MRWDIKDLQKKIDDEKGKKKRGETFYKLSKHNMKESVRAEPDQLSSSPIVLYKLHYSYLRRKFKGHTAKLNSVEEQHITQRI